MNNNINKPRNSANSNQFQCKPKQRGASRTGADNKRKKDKQQLFLYRTLVYLIALSILTVITIICISCSHNYKAPSDTDSKITVDSSSETDDNADLSYYLMGDTIYINFTKLALECDMVITGSDTAQTFTVVNDSENETLSITVDSETATVNGVEVEMQAKAILREDDVWLCASFIKNTVSGVTVNFDTETKTLTIKRNELNASTPQNPKYEKIYFKHNIPVPNPPVTDPQNPPIVVPTYEFKLDLSSYEKYMNPENPEDYLIIANRDNLLSKNFVPEDLVVVYKAAGTADKYKMTKTAAMAFEALVKEGAANGLNIFAVSGYRSYSTQEYLFNRYVNGHINDDGMTYEEAFAMASTYSQIAGASEHQTGLTMDVNRTEQDFGDTKEGKWLAENAHKFGFVIRYPEDKEDVTGISWEPWHLRYVGRSNAVAMKELDMCLEEYVEYLEKN